MEVRPQAHVTIPLIKSRNGKDPIVRFNLHQSLSDRINISGIPIISCTTCNQHFTYTNEYTFLNDSLHVDFPYAGSVIRFMQIKAIIYCALDLKQEKLLSKAHNLLVNCKLVLSNVQMIRYS